MLYNIVIIVGILIAKLISLFDNKMKKIFSLRKGEINRVSDFFKNRGKPGKVIWFHSASAGEFEQVKPVVDYLKNNKKDITIVCSFFSPSGYEAGLKYENADFCFSLPFDFKKNMRKILNSINPSLIIYTKYDVWKNLTLESFRRGIKMILMNGTLPEKSYRHKLPTSLFFGNIYSRLFMIYAISEKDALRFKKMIGTVNYNNIIVSGDSRFDRIKTVIDNTETGARIIDNYNGNINIVAGSTYEVSEKKLLAVLKRLKGDDAHVRLIMVPHEVNSRNVKRLGRLISSYGFKPVYFSSIPAPARVGKDEILVVDAYGVLAGLYSEADIVFIGGSFKGSVHSVLEPAIFGKPVIAGPYIDNAYEAIRLKDIGGLVSCKSNDDLYRAMLDLANDKERRLKISDKLIHFFNDNTGATELILKDLERII